MAKQRYYLDIDNCIIIHDVKQIKKEPAEPKIKTKNQLAKKLVKSGLVDGTKVSIYTKLSRAEKDGYITEDKILVEALLKTLEVTRKDLVKTVV